MENTEIFWIIFMIMMIGNALLDRINDVELDLNNFMSWVVISGLTAFTLTFLYNLLG